MPAQEFEQHDSLGAGLDLGGEVGNGCFGEEAYQAG